MYICPDCGADMKFNPSSQKLHCEYCGKVLDPEAYQAPNIRSTYTAHVFTCPSCGAEIISTDETVATFCSYCGNSVLLKSRIQEEDCPDYIIPFKITREACEQTYKTLLRKALFVPGEMKEDTQIERFRGIYMPFWIYSFAKDGKCRVRGSRARRKGDYIYTKHYRLDSHLTASCKGLSYDAASTFADHLSASIAPFNAQESTKFTPTYLSGFYADRGDVSADIYQSEARDLASQYVANEINKNRTYRKYNVSQKTLASAFQPDENETSLGMFPVWFLGCKSKDGTRISYAVVNGQTGKVAAELPIDMRKYILGSLVLTIPLFILLNLFLTLTPAKALLFSIALAFISLILSNRQLNQIYTRDLKLDDMGHRAVNGSKVPKSAAKAASRTTTCSVGNTVLRVIGIMVAMWGLMLVLGFLMSLGLFRSAAGSMFITGFWFFTTIVIVKSTIKKPVKKIQKSMIYPAPMKEKLHSLYKPLLAIAIALSILLFSPVSDLFYYIGAAVSLGCVIWSFFDIIKEHNLLTTRKLPQLGRRGGDENA